MSVKTAVHKVKTEYSSVLKARHEVSEVCSRNEKTIASIASTILCKQKIYRIYINNHFARFARIPDPPVKKIETDSVFLRIQVKLPEPLQSPRLQHKDSILDGVLMDETFQDTTDEEVIQFLRANAWPNSKKVC